MAAIGHVVGKTKSDLRTVVKHPVFFVLFGMVFAAFLFPMIATWLGKVKAKGGALSKVVPNAFTRSA